MQEVNWINNSSFIVNIYFVKGTIHYLFLGWDTECIGGQ